MRGANMKIIKYLIKKDIYIFELQNNFPDKILDVINLLFFVLCRCPSVVVTATLSNAEDQEDATNSWPWKKEEMADILQHLKASAL
jgi:hypothetical protein